MATIPLGRGGRAMPGRMPSVRPTSAGMATARVLEQAGATGVQIGLQQQADETRNQARDMQQQLIEQRAEMQRQQQVAEAAARAKDALALQTAEDALADAHDQLGQEVLQGRTPKEEAERQWAERSRKVLDDLMPTFREETRALVGPRLEGASLRLGNSLRRVVERKDRQDITADMTTRLERLSRDYAANPAMAEQQAMALFDTVGPMSDLAPDQLARARQTWKEQAQFTAGFAAVSAGRTDRRALADAEKLIGGLADLDPQRKAQLLDRVQSYRMALDQQAEMQAARAARAAEAALRKAGAEFETFQALADKGTALAPEYLDRVLSATAGTPYQAGVRALAEQARANGGLAAQPVPAQRAALDAIDAQIAQNGRTPELDKRRQQVAGVLSGTEADIGRDPLRAGLERGVIEQLQPLDFTGGLQTLGPQLQARVQQAQRVSVWAGQPVAPLTSDEAQGLAKLMAAMDPATKGTALGALAQVIPPQQAQALARQIDSKDRPLALALAAGATQTTQGRLTSELILRGAQAMKDKAIKVEGGAEFGLKAQVAKEIGDAVPGQARNDLIDAAVLIYVGKQAEGSTGSVAGAVRLALGGDLVEHNGRRIPVPMGMDSDAVRQRLMQLPRQAIERQAPDGFVYLPGGRPMGVPEFLATLPEAQLEAAGLGRYMVRSGGSLVLNRDRRPIVVETR